MLLVAFIPKSGNTIIEAYGLDEESQLKVLQCRGPVLEVDNE
jgi:hypothetical protein